jgi:cobalt-precorrin 5A hydrolase
MKISILAFTGNGVALSLKIKELLDAQGNQAACYQPEKLTGTVKTAGMAEPIAPDLKVFTGRQFAEKDALIFVGACGIAVRAIAPFIQDKTKDPAVLCIDEKGRFVIPLLSGHIGGANMLADRISEALNAIPVITTATDINRLFSVDEWAAFHDAWISDLKAAKEISARLLAEKPVGFYSELDIEGEMPRLLEKNESNMGIGICVSLNDRLKPYPITLNIVPRTVYLGIGCRRGTPLQCIEDLVLEQLSRNSISFQAIAGIASIDLKTKEQGLLDFAAKNNLPLHFFSSDELLSVPGKYTESEFVSSITGVGNVCERAALMVSAGGGLISRKVSGNGVTIALAQKEWRVSFEY